MALEIQKIVEPQLTIAWSIFEVGLVPFCKFGILWVRHWNEFVCYVLPHQMAGVSLDSQCQGSFYCSWVGFIHFLENVPDFKKF